MEFIGSVVDLALHLDRHLSALVLSHGDWVYGILFLIVFLETGLVVTPFLPGDSLLFVAGAIASKGALDVNILVILLFLAAALGDSVNYSIGRYFGPRVFRFEDSRFFRRSYVERTREFFERHGGKTIVIARFVPIIRTYAPFVAGVGAMEYGRFLAFNVAGALLWVASLTYAGYFFGWLPWVRDNLTLVILGIIFLSILPGIVEIWRQRRKPAAGAR